MVQAAKRLLADALGVTAGGARAPGIAELNARLARWEAGGSATGLVGKRRFSPPTAALANGAAAHALDYDDIHDGARVHSMCVVLPALLAAAEDAGPVDGKTFLLGVVVGAELHARLGLACPDILAAGWHPTTLFGSMAASLAVGRILNLQPEALRNALGIAFHQAGGSVQSAYDGVISKRLGPGFAARDAVTERVPCRRRPHRDRAKRSRAGPGSSPCTRAARRGPSSSPKASAAPGASRNTA